jgi:hypothetical protein
MPDQQKSKQDSSAFVGSVSDKCKLEKVNEYRQWLNNLEKP